MNSKNPYLPYGCQTITEEDIESVIEVLRSPFLTQGPVVPRFELKVAEKVNSLHGVAVNSATSALHISCIALGLKEGDWLWTSPITFVASANCGLYCGASIDFVDIDSETGLISTTKLENKLEKAKEEGRLPKIVVPVHLTGTSCDMKKMFMLAKKYDFKIIEDASHALGGMYEGEYIGNCKYSDIAVFSFHPVKIATTGEGGMAVTNSEKIYRRLKMLRSHGITKDINMLNNKSKDDWYYEQQLLGYNYRMTDIAAALGISQMNRLEEFVKRRIQIKRRYIKELDGMPIRILKESKMAKSSVHLVVIKMKDEWEGQRDKFYRYMKSNGVGVQLHYLPVYRQPYYEKYRYNKDEFPNAEEYGKNAISIPVYPSLEQEEQTKVVELIKKFNCN